MSLFTSTPRERRMALRAGLFAALGLVLAGMVVFFIGQETRLFEQQVSYRAFFPNVQGLTDKSPVLAGRPGGGPGARHRLHRGLGRARHPGDHPGVEASSPTGCGRTRWRGCRAWACWGRRRWTSRWAPRRRTAMRPGELRTDASRGPERADQAAGRGAQGLPAISQSLRAAVDDVRGPEAGQGRLLQPAQPAHAPGEVEKGDGVLHALIYDKEAGKQVRGLLANASPDGAADGRGGGPRGGAARRGARRRRHGARAHLRQGGRPGARASWARRPGSSPGSSRTPRRARTARCTSWSTGTRRACSRTWAARRRTSRRSPPRWPWGGHGGRADLGPHRLRGPAQVLGNVKRNKVLQELVRITVSNKGGLEQAGPRPTAVR